tara:strand:+ start:154 stop:498 length:345 start_codon:yes stop_codon:yes gene_type:complete
MNDCIKNILETIDISYQILENNEIIIERDIFLSMNSYNNVKKHIPQLKKIFSSSFLTSLQKNALDKQKWPLLNLIRQILKKNNYIMNPIRRSNGYTQEGKKLFKRFFIIKKLAT